MRIFSSLGLLLAFAQPALLFTPTARPCAAGARLSAMRSACTVPFGAAIPRCCHPVASEETEAANTEETEAAGAETAPPEDAVEEAAADDEPLGQLSEKEAAAAALAAEKKELQEQIAKLERTLTDKRGELISAQDQLKDAGEAGYMLLAANFERFRVQAKSEIEGQVSADL